MEQDFLNTYEPTCQTLCQLGWFVAPYILQSEYTEIKMLCTNFRNELTVDSQKRVFYENKINELLSDTAFHPNYRAFFIFRSKEVPHVSEYSHLYERGIYHYYKMDYTSAILTMLPAVEGSLLSFYGWSFGSTGRKPSQAQLLSKLKSEVINSGHPDIQRIFGIYGRVLSEFLEKWIFSDTDTADLSTSWLNRHVLAHGMAPVNINRQSDANRLILFFDLFITYLSMPINKHYVFIPENKEILTRRDYLFNLLKKNTPIQESIAIEEAFLRQNKNYVSPEHTYGLQNAIAKNLERLNAIKKSSDIHRTRIS